MGSRNLLISGIDVSRDPLCEFAIKLFDMVKRNLCTSCFLQIPGECVAADHRCLVPNADRKPVAATYHPGMGRTPLGPGPT